MRKPRLVKKRNRAQRFMELKYKRLFPETGDRLWAFRYISHPWLRIVRGVNLTLRVRIHAGAF